MALSLKTISVGSETGVQDIQSNFTTIKSAVDALQNSVSEIKLVRDFTCVNGTNNGTSGNISNITFLNFPKYQMMFFNSWINNINLSTPWQRKDIVSIPKKYFRFSKIANFTNYAPTWVVDGNKVIDVALDLETGIINVTSRQNVPIESASVQFYAIFTD